MSKRGEVFDRNILTGSLSLISISSSRSLLRIAESISIALSFSADLSNPENCPVIGQRHALIFESSPPVTRISCCVAV
jgi:hypothetical protein